ncbi:hypothetical protein V6N13_088404 [Hibiscus sabdariffa]
MGRRLAVRLDQPSPLRLKQWDIQVDIIEKGGPSWADIIKSKQPGEGKIGQAKEFGKVKKPYHHLRALEDMSLMGFHSFELDQIDPSVVGDNVVDLVDEQIVYSLDGVQISWEARVNALNGSHNAVVQDNKRGNVVHNPTVAHFIEARSLSDSDLKARWDVLTREARRL